MIRRIFTIAACLWLAGCTSSQVAYRQALANPAPPEDFWMSATVVGPVRSAGYAQLARAERPGRYVVEADRILRASQGPGADERQFPPQLRQLTEEQWAQVWDTLRSSNLAHHPGKLSVSMAPRLEEAPDTTVIIIAYSAEGTRRTVSVNLTSDTVGEAEKADAKKIVDLLADLAWIPERTQAGAATATP